MLGSEDIRGNPLASREDAQRLLAALTEPLLSCFSPGRAQVKLGEDAAHFDRKAAWFEGYARPLWGLAPLAAGGGSFGQWQLWREGLTNGSNPAHSEFWGLTSDHNQRSVEMAALGFALALAPDELFAPLDAAAKRNVAAFLSSIQTVGMADNNWHFFPVMAGLGLERIGAPVDHKSRLRHLERIDDFYLDQGWYGDGDGGYIDHYNGFALHFYGLIYARHCGEEDPLRAGRYTKRAIDFAQTFRHFFGTDGAALAQGRSLTYRFACAAFWGALAYANVEALPWGEIRGLWARHIRWWLRQPIFDARGALTVGYRWPTYIMSEEYNSPGSPYWAFKAFLPLALPASHPFWTAQEATVPRPAEPVVIKPAATIIKYIEGDAMALMGGPVRPGMRNATDKYGKFAYSTRFGLCVEADRWIDAGFCGDNILAFSRDGRHFMARESTIATRVLPGLLETRWQPFSGVDVTTLQAFDDDFEIRLHSIVSEFPVKAVESGHSVPGRSGSRGRLAGAFKSRATGVHAVEIAVGDGHSSMIGDLSRSRDALAADAAPNTNLVFPHAAVPVLLARLRKGESILATVVRACYRGNEAPMKLSRVPEARTITAMLSSAGWPARLSAGLTHEPQHLNLRIESMAATE